MVVCAACHQIESAIRQPLSQCLRIGDDLAGVLDLFSRHDVNHLPVRVSRNSAKIVGMISRAELLRRYQRGLESS
jgi:hypothetical protein